MPRSEIAATRSADSLFRSSHVGKRTDEDSPIAYFDAGIAKHHFLSVKERTMNKDQVKGQVEQATGKIKEIAGKAVGNKALEVKGKIQNVGGKIQAGFGDLKEVLKKAGDKK